jgi:hypothetical protein
VLRAEREARGSRPVDLAPRAGHPPLFVPIGQKERVTASLEAAERSKRRVPARFCRLRGLNERVSASLSR